MAEIIIKEYVEDLKEIKEKIRINQNNALVIVNTQMLNTYYEIGSIINKRKKWGSQYINNLSKDLKSYGKSFSSRNLYYMSQYANEFSINEILHQPGAQIPWRTIIEIMRRSKSHDEMLFYINETYKNKWSRNMLINQFSLKTYERSLISPYISDSVKEDDNLVELFKDTYVFDFLDREKIKKESDLKNQMIENIIKLLQELGSGFSLVGKEYKIVSPSNKEYFIDLLMYHTKIHSYVVIEVKIGEFKAEDIGQLMFYVNLINDVEKMDTDDETVGILLCKEADRYVAESTLKNVKLKLGISKYKFIDEIEKYLSDKLNETKY